MVKEPTLGPASTEMSPSQESGPPYGAGLCPEHGSVEPSPSLVTGRYPTALIFLRVMVKHLTSINTSWLCHSTWV